MLWATLNEIFKWGKTEIKSYTIAAICWLIELITIESKIGDKEIKVKELEVKNSY